MIDVSPYQHRLEVLKEWIGHKIDGTLPITNGKSKAPCWINISCVPEISWEEVIRLYDQTGVLFFNNNSDYGGMRPVDFEEYLQMIKIFNKWK